MDSTAPASAPAPAPAPITPERARKLIDKWAGIAFANNAINSFTFGEEVLDQPLMEVRLSVHQVGTLELLLPTFWHLVHMVHRVFDAPRVKITIEDVVASSKSELKLRKAALAAAFTVPEEIEYIADCNINAEATIIPANSPAKRVREAAQPIEIVN